MNYNYIDRDFLYLKKINNNDEYNTDHKLKLNDNNKLKIKSKL